MEYKGAVKAGKLANGYERDKGKIVHIVESGDALCGTPRPKNQWSYRELGEATCPKCIKKLIQEIQMKHFVEQIDDMIKGG